MESKIPYKKDLIIKTTEEINTIEKQRENESLQKDLEYFDNIIARLVNYYATESKYKHFTYSLFYISDYTSNKKEQNIILEYIQNQLTEKGYTNYIANIKFDSDRLIVLIDDSFKDSAENNIKSINKDNIFSMIVMLTLLISFVAFISCVFIFCR